MSELMNLAQVVSSEPPAGTRRSNSPRRNEDVSQSRPAAAEGDEAARRGDSAPADRSENNRAEQEPPRRDSAEGRDADREGSFKHVVRKAIERAEKNGKDDDKNQAAVLQATLAAIEQTQGSKSARKDVPLSALNGHNSGGGDKLPDAVHQAVLAALGKQARTGEGKTTQDGKGQLSGEWLAGMKKDHPTASEGKPTGQKDTAQVSAQDRARAKDQLPEKPTAMDAPSTGKASNKPEGGARLASQAESARDARERPAAIEEPDGNRRNAEPTKGPSPQSNGSITIPDGTRMQAQHQGGQGMSEERSGQDSRGRTALNQATVSAEGRAGGEVTLNTSDRTFETTMETVSSQQATTTQAAPTPTVATAATAAAQNAPVDQSAEVSPAEQVFAQMRANLRGAGDSIVIRLDPPELGQVRISLEMDADGLRAELRTTNAQTLGDLQREAQTLITRLTEAGIQVRRLDVQPAEQTGDRAMHDPAEGQSQQETASAQTQDESSDTGRGEGNGTDEGESTGATVDDQHSSDPTDPASALGNDGSVNVMM